MCRFTRIFWTKCEHFILSDTPEHTQLCRAALDPDEEIRPGFDRAPAFCYPLAEDVEELGTQYRDSDRVAQTNCLYTLCPMCKDNLDISPEHLGAGKEMEKLVEAFDAYSDDDRIDLARWQDLHLSDTIKTQLALQELEHLLRTEREAMTAAIASIHNDTVRTALLDADSRERWLAFRKTHQETAALLAVATSYMKMNMLKKMVNDVLACVQNKLYQTDLRFDIFTSLLQSLRAHATDPTAYQAAINFHADRLAVRLGEHVIPDAGVFEHLTADMPQHIQDTIATKQRVRSRSIKAHSSRIRTRAYTPRSAFGLGKNKNMLTVDLERAWNPPPQARSELPVQRTIGEHVEVSYDRELQIRESLSPLGVGLWGKEDMLAQKDVIGGRDAVGPRDEVDDGEDTLVGSSPDRPAPRVGSVGTEELTVSDKATFMGMPLENSDSEVSDVAGIAHGQNAHGHDAGRVESVTTETDKAVWRRDGNGRLLKRRKCLA